MAETFGKDFLRTFSFLEKRVKVIWGKNNFWSKSIFLAKSASFNFCRKEKSLVSSWPPTFTQIPRGRPKLGKKERSDKEITKGFGLLFEEGDEKELAKLILQLKENKEYANKVASACYERAKKYDIEKTFGKLIQVYNSVLSINA